MKLATLKRGGRDGTLAVVSRDLAHCQTVADIATTLQQALDDWEATAPRLAAVYEALNHGAARHAEPFDPRLCASPLPRAYQWADGSAYVNHVELVRKARGAELPPEFWTDPLMYQGGSDSFAGPTIRSPPPAKTGASTSRPRWRWSPATCRWAPRRRNAKRRSAC
jgi:fumarylacetoacetate (FAA) hydrolase